MEKNFVYRIEHQKCGFGPLCAEGCNLHKEDWFVIAINHEDVECEYPEFFEAEVGSFKDSHRFGMDSLESLKTLFRDWKYLSTLFEYGFKVFKIEVSKMVKFPDGQVVYDLDDVICKTELL